MTEDPPQRTTARRQRQLAEIGALAAAGKLERAGGLAREHAAEFPDDAENLQLGLTVSSDWSYRYGISDHTRGDPDADAHRSVP